MWGRFVGERSLCVALICFASIVFRRDCQIREAHYLFVGYFQVQALC